MDYVWCLCLFDLFFNLKSKNSPKVGELRVTGCQRDRYTSRWQPATKKNVTHPF